jgi:hypothetical protein
MAHSSWIQPPKGVKKAALFLPWAAASFTHAQGDIDGNDIGGDGGGFDAGGGSWGNRA